MPVLVGSLLESFVRKLEACEAREHELNDWERRFVKDTRERFDERETMEDLGMTPWNPTSNQWNTLSGIAEKVK